jgi:tetratricopeptide (TPR) repeat protein
MKNFPFPRRLLAMLVAAVLFLAGTLAWQMLVVSPEAASPASIESIRVGATVDNEIERLLNRLEMFPEDAEAYAFLGLARLQEVRETGDASIYALAEGALNEALRLDSQQVDAHIGQGLLALARHDFRAALDWGQRAYALNPYRAQPLGIQVDGYIELGMYEEAAETLQAMVDLRPDLASFSRISYIRELNGDIPGAIEAMESAIRTGTPGHENTLWTQVQLGHLHFNSGGFELAQTAYQQALSFKTDYSPALAGMARVYAAWGEVAAAIDLLVPVVERFPQAEYVILLGELYEVTGQTTLAQQQYELVRVIQQLNASTGMDVDLELALFDADHGGNNTPAQTLASAQAAYQRRPSIHAADVLAWAFYKNGDYQEAWTYSQEALRLGTRDALMHFHAGMIAYALGDEIAARTHLEEALAINPGFSVLYAGEASELLETLK